jgi:hypothetical protein
MLVIGVPGSQAACRPERITDLADLTSALEGSEREDAFVPAAAPSGVGANEYYFFAWPCKACGKSECRSSSCDAVNRPTSLNGPREVVHIFGVHTAFE